VPDPVAEAALNNAGWCDAVCRALGLQPRWAADTWSVPRRSPDGYPDAVTLVRGADARAVLHRLQNGAGCSVKDSFADLDLAPWGFRVLFDATWIRRLGGQDAAPPALEWREVRTPSDLDQWSRRHDLDVFRPALLDVEDLHLFHAPGPGAGFALHRTGRVVGVSNTVPGDAANAAVWADLVAVAGTVYPGLDLVGYETGEDLAAATASGFVSTAPLRVWIREGSTSPPSGQACG
jgi:hypothetical protein